MPLSGAKNAAVTCTAAPAPADTSSAPNVTAALLAMFMSAAALAESLHEALTAARWAWEFQRFHQFDGIRNDRCPCCNSPVKVEENGNGHVVLTPRWERL